MNDRVKDIFEQMFAPDPIPARVIAAFEHTNHIMSRIDAPEWTIRDMCIIAAMATFDGSAKAVVVTKPAPKLNDTIDTSEPESLSPPVTDLTSAETNNTDGPLPRGVTGPMDAPSKPATKKRRAMSAKKLMELSRAEMAAHAEEFYGWKPPRKYRKKDIMIALKQREPIR